MLGVKAPIPDEDFYFHTSLWGLKGFMKALKVFIKPFGAPQRSVRIKI